MKKKAEDSNSGRYTPDKIYLVHESALTGSESAFDKLRQDGRNCILIPFATWERLNYYQTGTGYKSDIARAIIRKVRQLVRENDPSVRLMNHDNRLGVQGELRNLRKDNNDHRVIAAAVQATKENKEKPVILVTQNANMEVLALHYNLQVEPLKIDRADHLPVFGKRSSIILNEGRDYRENKISIDFSNSDETIISENEGVICCSEFEGQLQENFAAIRKGDYFEIIDDNINLYGVRPMSNNGNTNWSQKIAMQVLLDETIDLVTLTGGAGTAKTFLALLGAFAQSHSYHQILISRATIHMGDKDRLGFLPGEFDEKMKPWMLPIFDNINAIKELVGANGKKEIEGYLEGKNPKMEILDLDKIRGRSIQRRYIIVDEIQNLPPEHVKAIVTRGGEGTKIVLTGDFSQDQIDVNDLDEYSNGLTIINSVMRGSKRFATVHLDQAIRSPLTQEILDRWEKWQNRFQ